MANEEQEQPQMFASRDGAFPATRWSIVLGAGVTCQDRNQALETLCRSYWYPLYAYLRRTGKSEEDAKDLTQGFFVRFLNREDFKRADQEKGRFRSYLLKSLKNYVANEYRKENAQKRGGDAIQFSIDEDVEDRYTREPADNTTPERLFEKSWAVSVLTRVFSNLENEYARTGKEALFQSLRSHITGSGEVSYADVAQRHDLTVGAVTMTVKRMRTRYGQLLREEITETVADGDEVDDEIRFLMGALAA